MVLSCPVSEANNASFLWDAGVGEGQVSFHSPEWLSPCCPSTEYEAPWEGGTWPALTYAGASGAAEWTFWNGLKK